uniref:Coiled-coil domain containing 137 n=1 Tax=Jaculus jaculus TaxID=51337 RepID=A0A8C5KRY2_JACJA
MVRARGAAAAPARTAGPGASGRPEPRGQRRGREKKKVNCKPRNQDEQEIPFRLREIMRSRQEMKNPLSNKKRKKEDSFEDTGKGSKRKGARHHCPQ